MRYACSVLDEITWKNKINALSFKNSLDSLLCLCVSLTLTFSQIRVYGRGMIACMCVHFIFLAFWKYATQFRYIHTFRANIQNHTDLQIMLTKQQYQQYCKQACFLFAKIDCTIIYNIWCTYNTRMIINERPINKIYCVHSRLMHSNTLICVYFICIVRTYILYMYCIHAACAVDEIHTKM